MVEQLLQQFLVHPSRRWIVITLTFAIGLVAVWPAADDYLALTGDRARLKSEIAQAEETVSRLKAFQEKVSARVSELKQREAEAVTESIALELRGQIVSLARKHSCQVRRINLSDKKTRRWREKDNPLDKTARAGSGKETKFELQTQQFKLTVIGALPAIADFLAELQGDEKLVHTSVFSLRPSSQNRKTAELELELTMFDLNKKLKKKKSA